MGGGDAIHFNGFNPDDPLSTPMLDSIQFADGTPYAKSYLRDYQDLSRDVARAIRWALKAAPGEALPIVGVGGVLSGRDALDLIDAGATAVQVGTALFRDPCAVARIHDELQALVENRR